MGAFGSTKHPKPRGSRAGTTKKGRGKEAKAGAQKDKTNKACMGCGITFGRREKFLQQCRNEHEWRIRVKKKQSPHPPNPRDPPSHWNPTLKTSPREGGLNILPTLEEEELRQREQNQKELGDRTTANKSEKKKTNNRTHADGEAGRKESRTQTQGQRKDEYPKEAQVGAKNMDRELNTQGRGQDRKGRKSPRWLEPPEGRSRLEPGAHVYRGVARSSPPPEARAPAGRKQIIVPMARQISTPPYTEIPSKSQWKREAWETTGAREKRRPPGQNK